MTQSSDPTPPASLASRMGPVPDDSAPAAPATTTPANTTAQAAPPATEKAGDGEKHEEEEKLVQSNYEVAVKLADMQGDPNSPLYSVKRFEDLGL